MMTLFSSTPNAYAPYDPDSGAQSIYLFEGKLYYYYQSQAVTKTLSGNWIVEEGTWGFATVARYYSTTDGTQTV